MTFINKAILHQFLALLPISTLSFVVGMVHGFLPTTLHHLRVEKTDIQLNDEQAAFMGSLQHVGRFVVAIPAGLLAERIGRKPVSFAVGVLYSATWLGLYATNTKEFQYFFSFALGIGTGIVNAVHQMYAAELVSASVRGNFSAFIWVNANLGSLVMSVLGVYLPYKRIVLSSFLIGLVYFTSIFWLTESPYFLLSVNRENKARKTLAWLRCGISDEVVESEFADMKAAIETRQRLRNGKSLFALITSKDNIRCMAVLISINFSAMFTGSIVVKLYSTFLFPDQVSILADPTEYPFFVSCLELCCSLIPPLYMDRLNRRTLFYICSFAIGLIHVVTAVSFYLYQYTLADVRYVRFPLLTSVLLNLIVSNVSLTPLISVLRGELLPQSFRGVGAGIAVVAQAISLFFSILLFERVQKLIGMYMNFVIFALASFSIPIIVCTSLPETKGKTLVEIQQSLNSRQTKRNKSSQISSA